MSKLSLEGKRVAIAEMTGSGGPLPDVFASVFAGQGATVERLHGGDSAHLDSDALVYFPAALPPGPTLELLAEPESIAALNAELARFLTTFGNAAGAMQRRRHGCVLIVGNLSASTGWPGFAIPSALHGALLALTRSLACEFATSNVRVLYLSRGAVEGETPDLAARAPHGRAAAPDEIARAAAHLISDRASFMTGTEVRADGGWKSWGLLR